MTSETGGVHLSDIVTLDLYDAFAIAKQPRQSLDGYILDVRTEQHLTDCLLVLRSDPRCPILAVAQTLPILLADSMGPLSVQIKWQPGLLFSQAH